MTSSFKHNEGKYRQSTEERAWSEAVLEYSLQLWIELVILGFPAAFLKYTIQQEYMLSNNYYLCSNYICNVTFFLEQDQEMLLILSRFIKQ